MLLKLLDWFELFTTNLTILWLLLLLYFFLYFYGLNWFLSIGIRFHTSYLLHQEVYNIPRLVLVGMFHNFESQSFVESKRGGIWRYNINFST